MDLRKSPSISETLDWAKALVSLNARHLDGKTLETTLSILLKHESDLQRTKKWTKQRSQNEGPGDWDSSRLSRWKN
jgi:predicted component of type VI protein secretion system